jgi:hypothetical protein
MVSDYIFKGLHKVSEDILTPMKCGDDPFSYHTDYINVLSQKAYVSSLQSASIALNNDNGSLFPSFTLPMGLFDQNNNSIGNSTPPNCLNVFYQCFPYNPFEYFRNNT